MLLTRKAFWHEGMTPEKYEIERVYYCTYWDGYTKGLYTPLWKQAFREELTQEDEVIGDV